VNDSITIATDIVITAPPERVWSVLIDFAGYTDWNPYLVRIDGDAVAGGTITVHAVNRPGAEPMTQPVDVVAVAFPEMAWEGGMADRGLWKGDHRFRVAAHTLGTRFDHFEHFSGSEAARLLDAYGDVIRDNFIRFNMALKRRCEA
jgi:hypothetical protein